MATKKIEQIVCDICGGEVNQGWWECVTRCGEVVEENYTPIDLCDDCCVHFTEVADKWKQERYERFPLDSNKKAECIKEVSNIKENSTW